MNKSRQKNLEDTNVQQVKELEKHAGTKTQDNHWENGNIKSYCGNWKDMKPQSVYWGILSAKTQGNLFYWGQKRHLCQNMRHLGTNISVWNQIREARTDIIESHGG